MAEANPERGEHALVLAGTNYRLRPSFAANVAIERKTERSLLELVRAGNGGGLTLDQLGVIGAELIRAGAGPEDSLTRAVTAERIGELIYEEGLGSVMPRISLCLLDAVTGGVDASGNARAATAHPTPNAGAASQG